MSPLLNRYFRISNQALDMYIQLVEDLRQTVLASNYSVQMYGYFLEALCTLEDL